IIFLATTITFVGIYFILRYFRTRYDAPPKFLPAFIKARWKTWGPSRNRSGDSNTSYTRARLEDNEASPNSMVDRTQSVRSIMTLPEYRAIANPDREQTIAREGERGGIDVIVEFPESQTEEEARRETHMQTLYEIRLARAAEREERRARREARRRGGSLIGETSTSRTPTSELVASVIASRSATSLAALIAEPPARLPQVSYASLGTVRPDGTRIRAASDASDRQGLLEGAAIMGEHARNGSSSSSIHTASSAQLHGAYYIPPSTYAGYSANASQQTLSLSLSRQSSDTLDHIPTSTSMRPSTDLTDMRNPPNYDVLEFEQAPAYESPVTSQMIIPNLVLSTPSMRTHSLLGPSGDLTSPRSVNVEENSLYQQLPRL
ncbi:hypothetical protein DFH27DRAFT_478069, partial [Peziza echinospora]